MTTTPGRKAFTMFVPRLHSHRRVVAVAVGLAVLTMTACGSDDTSQTSATASAAPSAAPSGAPDAAAFQEIRTCLEAAGLDASEMPGGPAGSGGPPSGVPSGLPSGMPSGAPSDMPSGMPSGRPGEGGGAMMLSDEAQVALKACGITMPSRPPAGSPMPTPSGTASG